MPSLSIIPVNPPSREQTIRDVVSGVFRQEALDQGISEPISNEQTDAWLRFIMPKIEEAYGVPAYRVQSRMFDRALDEIRRIFSQLGESPDKVLGYVFTGRRGGDTEAQ
ncbi:hypothetical protein HOY82DRAFT_486571 [Tuber indicum]|nr:hypothetical protein HOY82DRAFT_486571 [Tuber indicum]